MPASTLLDGGFYEVSYDLPLENAYAVLPVLKDLTSQGEPALLDSRPTDSQRSNSAVLSAIETQIPADEAQPETELLSAQPTDRATLNFEDCEFETIDPDDFRRETLTQTVRTALRRYGIAKTNRLIVSYVFYSTVAPDLEVRAPEEWKEVVNQRTPVLLFMVWPQQTDGGKIWLYSPECRWETVKIGDEFSDEWKRVEMGSGQYVLQILGADTVKLIQKESFKRYLRS
ncbi:hypothetical protein B0H10DRAFT_1965242 [Mycena sp. CBHHK59/15]|nr:hypothetical protein B0H10DRAFT_1965242 [Mycena sp. CBHHK59/15]